MFKSYNTWESKIYPAFDEPIKINLKYLGKIKPIQGREGVNVVLPAFVWVKNSLPFKGRARVRMG